MKLNMNLDLAASSSAADWVKSSRIKEKDAKSEAKRLAELKQKQLDEEEEELVEQSSSLYNSSHLKGLKVMHAANDFEEGRDVILTLQDTSILTKDEDGKVVGLNDDNDVLENVNFADKDRRLERENKKRRLNQPIYSALDDYEFQDGFATGNRAPLLPQYEKEKKAQAKFELGDGGMASLESSTTGSVGVSTIAVQNLMSTTKEASDYFSAKEYTTFSKKKGRDKKNKTFRKKNVNEDEAEVEHEKADDGTIESKAMEVEESSSAPKLAPKTLAPIKFQSMDLDEDDPDMVQALARSRRLALMQRTKENNVKNGETSWTDIAAAGTGDRGAAIARALSAKSETVPSRYGGDSDDDDINVDGRRPDGTLVFNSTTEFSTRLQAHLSEKARAKTEALMRDLERGSREDREDRDSATNNNTATKSKGESVDMIVEGDDENSAISQERKTGDKIAENVADISGTMEDFAGLSDMEGSDVERDEHSVDADDDQLGFVHRQPLVGRGMASTLSLLQGSGELRRTDELAGRAKDSRQYDPSSTDLGVKLEYRDEFGRKLTQKEAFRQLSYKFHGYGPSQKKKEKRLKALEVQTKAQSSRAGILEGMGGTMKSLTQAQEATGRAHITIQGGASTGPPPLQLAAMIAKKKGASSSVKK